MVRSRNVCVRRHGCRRSRLGVVAVLGVVMTLGMAGSAGATVTISSFTTSPSTTVAGGHPNMTIGTNFSYSDSTDSVKNLQVYFPAGLIGNPNSVGQCSAAQLSSDTCPATSQIGTVTVVAKAAGIPLPVTSNGSVYNVTPAGSEPARIGIVIRPLGGLLGKTSMSGPVSIRLPGDEGLVSTFTNIPNTLPSTVPLTPPVAISIQSMTLVLDGPVNGGTAAFMRNPTSCNPAYSVAVVSSYENSASNAHLAGFTPTDCAHEPFNPGLSFAFGATTASTPSSLSVSLTMPSADMPRAQSDLNANVIFLPLGTQVNFAALPNIAACTDAQLATNSAAPAACPASSQIGTLTFTTPLLGTLTGQVYFATNLRLFLQINIKGQYAKLIGSTTFYGPWIVSILGNLPQVPFTNFTLTFSGGPNALVDSPPCGTDPAIGALFPWSLNPDTVLVPSVTISQTSTGAPCPAAASTTQTAQTRSLARDLATTLSRSTRHTNINRVLAQVMARHHLRAHGLRRAVSKRSHRTTSHRARTHRRHRRTR